MTVSQSVTGKLARIIQFGAAVVTTTVRKRIQARDV
jgi:hypothetical protein